MPSESARPARSAWSVRRHPAADLEGEVGGGAVAISFWRNCCSQILVRGRRWSSSGRGDRRLMLMSASPGRAATMVPARSSASELRGHRQITPNSAALTLGRSASLAPGAVLNDQRNLSHFTLFAPLTRTREAGQRDAIGGKQGDRQTNRPCPSFSTKNPIPTDVYAPAIGLCRDSIMMQSRKPSNSDF